MSELPNLDPAWMRRRQVPAKDHSLSIVAFVSAVLITLIVLIARKDVEMQSGIAESVLRAQAMSAIARQRMHDARRHQQATANITGPGEAYYARPASGMSSSIGDTQIHQCGYGSTSGYQRGPCKTPWVELAAPRPSTRHERTLDDYRVRELAEARLRAEQARFAELTGQGSSSSHSTLANPAPNERSKCAMAKSERDEAYRIVGNNRTYDFIKHWDDLVYDACKNT